MTKQQIKLRAKKIILKNRKSKRLFYSYKSYGVKGIVFDLFFYFLVKSGLNKNQERIKKQAIFLYAKSKHLNIFEKLFITKKRIQTIKSSSFEKQQLGKGILPFEEI